MSDQSRHEVRSALHAWSALVREVQQGTAIPFVSDGLTTGGVLRALLAETNRQTAD